MEPSTFRISCAITRKESHDTGIAVIVQCILEHAQLKDLVWHVLLAAARLPPIEQLHVHAQRLDPVPQMPEFGRDRARCQRFLKWPVSMRETQHFFKVNPHPIACMGALIALRREALRFVEDI